MSAYNKGYIEGQLEIIKGLESVITPSYKIYRDRLKLNLERYMKENKCLHYKELINE